MLAVSGFLINIIVCAMQEKEWLLFRRFPVFYKHNCMCHARAFSLQTAASVRIGNR